jgi:hypothetical protein
MNFINKIVNDSKNYINNTNTNNTNNTNSEKEKEMFFVFIINDKYVRWEIFSSNSTVNDVYNLLQTKYHVKYCTIYMNEIEISRYKLMKLSKLCKKDGDTMYISTDENYTLSSSIK